MPPPSLAVTTVEIIFCCSPRRPVLTRSSASTELLSVIQLGEEKCVPVSSLSWAELSIPAPHHHRLHHHQQRCRGAIFLRTRPAHLTSHQTPPASLQPIFLLGSSRGPVTGMTRQPFVSFLPCVAGPVLEMAMVRWSPHHNQICGAAPVYLDYIPLQYCVLTFLAPPDSLLL